MSTQLKTPNDYIVKSIDMNISNQKMITDLVSIVKKQDENMKLMAVKLLELGKTVEALKNVKSS
tara:strand:- start:429 stop:620 length:192 start_codon:yes stop_codon:yes gene_type:complete